MKSLVGTVLDAIPRPRAQNTPSNGPPVPYTGRLAMRGPWSRATTDAVHQYRMYGESGTLHSIVALYAEALSAVCWHLYRSGTPDTRLEDRVEVQEHLALDLWNRPNDFMTGQYLREITQMSLDLTGEGWIVVEKAGKLPIGLWPVRSDRMMPVPSADKYLAGYLYISPDGEQVPLGVDDVLVLRYPNPADPYRGLGPVQALLMDLDSARYSAEWNRNFFVNSAQPGGVIQVEKHLTDDEFTEMTTRWREQHQGVAQAHRVAVLENGATWVDAKVTQRDMQFVELRQLSADFIREAFRTHKHMLGQSDDVNLANAQAADYTFARWGNETRAARWQDMLNWQYLPLFGSTGKGVEFDHDTTVPEDQQTANQTIVAQANATALLVPLGFDSAAVLETVGLPPMPFTKPAAPVAGGDTVSPEPPQSPVARMRWRPAA